MAISRRFVGAVCVVVATTMVAGACTKKAKRAVVFITRCHLRRGRGFRRKLKVAFVPKAAGFPYFEAMNTGAQQAAATLGESTWLYQGPTSADAAAQAQIVRSFIQQKVDALIVAPNDPDSMAPLMQQAQDAGIKVLTSDTDAPNSVREAFVNQATAEGIGNTTAETLMKAMGGKGKWAIVSCGETAENLNSWIAVREGLRVRRSTRRPSSSTSSTPARTRPSGTQMATDLMSAHPDLKGLRRAVHHLRGRRRAGRQGRREDRPGVHRRRRHAEVDEAVPGGRIVLRLDPVERAEPRLPDGVGRRTARHGKTFAATNKVRRHDGRCKWDEASKTLVLGDPLLITTENVDQFNY